MKYARRVFLTAGIWGLQAAGLLRPSQAGRAIVGVCAAGGMSTAACLERV